MNRRRRLPQTDSLTPRAYRCPACCITARMQIVWPSWVCQVCKAKLVPADLHPRPAEHRNSQHADCDFEIDVPEAEKEAPTNPRNPAENGA